MGGRLTRLGPEVEKMVWFAVIFFLPVIFMPGVTLDAFNVPKLALLMAGVGMAAAARIASVAAGVHYSRYKVLALPAAFIAAPLLLSWVLSPYKGWALLGQYSRFEGLIPYLLVIAAGMMIADAFSDDLLPVVWALVAGATVAASYALLQAAGLDPLDTPRGEFVASTLRHGNFLGGFLAIALPVAVAIWIGDAGGRALAIVCTILISLGVVVSFSQGGWGAAVAGVAMTAGLLAGRRHRSAPLVGAGMALLVAVVFVGIVVLSMIFPDSPVVTGTTRARGQWWQAASSMGWDSPVAGRGPNSYAIESTQHRIPADALAHAHTPLSEVPHSVPLSFFANAGTLGMAGWLLFLFWAVRETWRRGREGPVVAGLAGGLVAYFVQSLVSSDQPALLFSLWIMLGALAASRVSHSPETSIQAAARPEVRIPRAALLMLSLVVGIAGLASGITLLYADYEAHQGRTAFDNGDAATGRDNLANAIAIRDDPAYRNVLADRLGRAALERGRQGRVFIDEMRSRLSYVSDLPFVSGMLIEARWLHRWSIFDLDMDREAVESLIRAIALDPYNPELRVSLATSLMRIERPDEAIEALEPTLDLLRRYPRYRLSYPQVWAALAVARGMADDTDRAGELLATAMEMAQETGAATSDCHVLLARQLVGGSKEAAASLPMLCPRPIVELARP